MFRLQPAGRHEICVCTNIACALVGAGDTLREFERELGIHAGQTTADGEFTLRTVECYGGCGWGPVVSVDERYHEPFAPDRVPAAPGRAAGGGRVSPTRRILLDFEGDRRDAHAYEQAGGYESLREALGMEPADVVSAVDASGLRGRGGAGFPTGRKASFLPKGRTPAYLCVNADESEPGTFKDREIMLRNPHALIEGILIMSYGISATSAFIYIRGEYRTEFEVLKRALEEAHSRGYVGRNVLGSGYDATVVLHRGAGAYICGEETALLTSLEGERGQPRSKPPFPAVAGLYAAPTLVNNVETLASVPYILEMGGEAYAAIGTERSKGTRVFSLSGNVRRPGNYELPLTATLRDLIEGHGGGATDGAVDQGDHPRRLLDAAAHARPARHRHRLRVDRRRRVDGRLGRRGRDRRPRLHGAAGAAGGRVLPPRELRQVHAVPRGHQVGRRHHPPHRGGHRLAGRPRPAPERVRPHPGQVPVPARRRHGDADRKLRHPLPGGVPAPYRRGRLPVRRAEPDREPLPRHERGAGVSTFHDAFLDVRRRIESGEDPELVVPGLLRLAEAQEEIDLAEALYADEADDE